MTSRPFSFFLTDLERSAKVAWAGVAGDIGWSLADWSLSVLAKRDDLDIARIVLLAESRGGRRVVLKHELRPDAPEGFAAQYGHLRRAMDACDWGGPFRMATPLHLDVERRACLLEWAPGRPMSDLAREAKGSPDRQHDLLVRAGAWASSFHGQQLDERRPFRPKFTLRYFDGIRAELDSGTRQVPEEQLFRQGLAMLHHVAPRFAGRESASCMQHGDLHMRNLIVNDIGITGIDFSKGESAPVGHDISKLLLDFVSLTVDPSEIPDGSVVPDRIRKAFFDGYCVVGPDDPSVNFLLYVKILSTWLHVPADPMRRTPGKMRTLDRIRPIAERAFNTA